MAGPLLALIDGLEGRTEQALARIDAVDPSPLDAHHRFHLGESFAVAGATDRALELLEQAVPGFYPYPFPAEHCRFIDSLRSLPRFGRVLATARELAAAFEEKED